MLIMIQLFDIVLNAFSSNLNSLTLGTLRGFWPYGAIAILNLKQSQKLG